MTTVPFDDPPPKPGRKMAWRAILAGLVIVAAIGGAVTAIGLLQLSSVTDAFRKAQVQSGGYIDVPSLPPVEAGKPQTIMLLGTDERLGVDREPRDEARSDTIILVRLDANAKAIAVTSIPRDFKVDFPDTLPDKINSAFSRGGAKLTEQTVRELLSRPGKPFKINHVVQISFTGFRELVDYLGCTWVDVDRKYFNDQGGPGGYATIDIEPGYQKLCGKDSLDYVRYRHTDTDFVRGARQQDYVRQLLAQPGVRSRLSLGRRDQLARLAGRYTRTDQSLETNKGIITLLKLGLGVADKPIVQVPFGMGQLEDENPFVVAPRRAIDETVDAFMNPQVETGAAEPAQSKDSSEEARRPPGGSKPSARNAKRAQRASRSWEDTRGMTGVTETGENMAISQGDKLGFPFYYPTLIPATGRFSGDNPRRYSIRVGDQLYRAYRIVVDVGGEGFGKFVGVQGMSWREPPILQGPHDEITVDRRKLKVFWDGRKVRLVAWYTENGVYWVSNTLQRDLPYTRMVAMARSLTRVHAG